jgi:hypothetical protein
VAEGILIRVVVLILVVLVWCLQSLASGPEAAEKKFASIGVQNSDEVKADEPVEPSTSPQWLDSVLARLLEMGREQPITRQDREEVDRELEPIVHKTEPAPIKQAGTDEPWTSFTNPPPAIPALYTSPKLDGEGVWTSDDLPIGTDGVPLAYKTLYRPSVDFPNAVVYMAMFDMSRISTRFFIGQTEPGMYRVSYNPEREELSRIVAVTNAMWMQQHARGGGAIFRGQVIYPMVPEMATLVIYQDDSLDIIEWTDDIPLSLVKDARQLRHLMVKDGAVVEQVVKNGKITDSEIGLGGFLLNAGGKNANGEKFWFLAHRTAFGIRDDGNLVFAMGHHVSTKDLAKALVLAGCKRAIHGDANIHNIVCNFYFRDEHDKIVRRDKLSPEQLKYTLKRYDEGYAKDFFAFYEK